MRRTLCPLGLGTAWATAQQNPTTSRPIYPLFRYDGDWSCLADEPNRKEWVDAVKYIPLAFAGLL